MKEGEAWDAWKAIAFLIVMLILGDVLGIQSRNPDCVAEWSASGDGC